MHAAKYVFVLLAFDEGIVMPQGIFRGLGDTRTPLYATVACNLLNIILNPLLIFGCKMGVAGSALGTLMAQVMPQKQAQADLKLDARLSF